MHKGECWHKKDSSLTKDQAFSSKQKKRFNKFLKVLKHSNDSNSDGYATDTSWKKKTTKEEKVFVMGVTANASDSKASVDSSTATNLLWKFCKKKKKWTKQQKAY